MRKEILKTYLKLLVPVTVILILFYLGRLVGIFDFGNTQANRLISVILFVLAASFSIALPILYRTWFANKIRNQNETFSSQFERFEKNLIIIAMTSPYFILFAVLFNIPAFYFASVVLFGFYSVYYYYPSEKRIRFEKKIFRVRQD